MVRTSDFHSGNRGSIPLRGTTKFNSMVGFPSGQRDQTVNLTAPPSKVRILPQPPSRINTTHFCVVFLFYFYKKGCIIIICMNININSLDILCDEIGGENV